MNATRKCENRPTSENTLLVQESSKTNFFSQMDAITAANSEFNLDEICDLVHRFKAKRVALGLTQTQVGQDFEASLGTMTFSQSHVSRIEKLDITPSQAKQIKPVLEVRELFLTFNKEIFMSDFTRSGSFFFSQFCQNRDLEGIFKWMLLSHK